MPLPDAALLDAFSLAEMRDLIGVLAAEVGIEPSEVGVFVRSRDQMDRARAAVAEAGQEALELSERDETPGRRMPIGTMHLAKGLEFKAVAIMACDDDVLPLRTRVDRRR